jgi:RNA polymerase sigma-70 factor, ECF subfamily
LGSLERLHYNTLSGWLLKSAVSMNLAACSGHSIKRSAAPTHATAGDGETPLAQLDPDQLSREYFARIHRAALVLCGDPWNADDLAQETFLVVAKQKNCFRGESQIYTWLYGILLNLERERRRKRDRRQNRLRIFRESQAEAQSTAPESSAAIESKEWKHSLWAQVADLPDGQRQALVLRFSEQLRYEDIAEVLGCPLGTVKSRIFHGLASLRAKLELCGDQFTVPRFPTEDLFPTEDSPPAENRTHAC